jgi:LacI family transcriptional regulator, galactose operon repressor
MPPENGQARTTLAAVAEAAGVSLPTVSKVANGRDGVSPETRERVQRLLTEYAWTPPGRRGAAPGQAVELVLDGLTSPYMLEIIRGVTEAGLQEDADIVLGRPAQGRSGATWVREVVDKKRHGVIVVTSRLTMGQWRAFTRARIPLVVIDPVNLPSPELVSVGATNWAGGLAGTEHLIDLGHRRIAALGGREDAVCSRARLHGYRAALDAAGLPFDPALVRYGDFLYEPAYRVGLELLALDARPTAVFAGSDLQAFGVIEAARRRGLRVPGDLSVVGFDDLPAARWAAPPLTTVRQPLADMGRAALRTLLRLAGGEDLDNRRVELATELVVRESTAEPVPVGTG